MSESAFPNGRVLEFQREKFNEMETLIEKGFELLATEMRHGFQAVTSELRITRDQGVVPVPILEKIMAANNEAYKDIFSTTNTNFTNLMTTSNTNFKSLIRIVCITITVLLTAYTGVRIFWPDASVKIETSRTDIVSEDSK